jgi:uncharacterized protein DUF3618
MDDATGRVGRKKKTTSTTTASAAATERETADPTLPQEADARAREIREEIAQTRDDMSETIEAIQDRLKPSTVVANATERVKSATTEKVRQMANTAGEAADRVMHNSFADTVRENPWPVAMIGIGAAWLWMKSRSDSGQYSTGRHAYGDDYTARDEYGIENDWRRRTAPARMPYRTSEYGEGLGYDDQSAEQGSSVGEYVDSVRGTARRTSRRAQNGFNRVLRENPLALGAAATIVGAAIGMTLPETDVENEWMGDARDTVVERAKEVAGDAAERVGAAADQVKDVASRAADAAKGT